MSEETSAAKNEMVAEKAKHDISTLLRAITHDKQSKYWYGKFIRWGLVEKDLHAIIDEVEEANRER